QSGLSLNEGEISNLNDSFHGKPDAGNLHVRFVEGKGGRKTTPLSTLLVISSYHELDSREEILLLIQNVHTIFREGF
ncbi:MAG: hypothetical protein KBA66_23195, partial [Leptospiraceae bacterium]|nr:hypothetical protein [Leptospiraceae bacterium]